MKRNWTIDELIDHWTLTPAERKMAKRAVEASNQLGRALLVKWFQYGDPLTNAPYGATSLGVLKNVRFLRAFEPMITHHIIGQDDLIHGHFLIKLRHAAPHSTFFNLPPKMLKRPVGRLNISKLWGWAASLS